MADGGSAVAAAVFPAAQSSVVPDPGAFFHQRLLSSPLPTNSFFQNFVLGDGDQPEYIHPYLVKSSGSALSLCYPSCFTSSQFIYQPFAGDLTLSSDGGGTSRHVVSAFDDLSVTLDLPPSLRFFLIRGSPYITCAATAAEGGAATALSLSSVHAIVGVSSDPSGNRHRVLLNSSQTFLLYSSSSLTFYQVSATEIRSAEGFDGVIRIAYLPDPRHEPVLDRFSSCYPVSGGAAITCPFCVRYRWEKEGSGDLLLLAHPLQLRLLSGDEGGGASVLSDFTYRSLDGDLVGVVGSEWLLKTDPIRVAWHSTRGVAEDGRQEVIAALCKDAGELLKPIATTSSYFFGKAAARAARLALIAEEVSFPEVIPAVASFLKENISPWLDGTFSGNGLLYEPKWGGVVTMQGAADSGADFGFGIYNDHHYHLGYFLYAIAVLSKLEPTWGRRYAPQAYAMVEDFMNQSRSFQGASCTKLRCFDLWKLHSWAGGLTAFSDGRNQESTSEAVNAYYAAALMGLSYGDVELAAAGARLAALEIRSAAAWWHVREEERIYEVDFRRENRIVGIVWSNKRDSCLWFAPTEWKECRLGIQVLPLLPITELLFMDEGFARELVNWASPALEREGVGEGWKGFVYALQGIYDKETALSRTRGLTIFDDGNSLTNMLWWLHSRD
ncbi:unnamed protein product [Spirodela intermedia]|uniref:glucan endo-1,3-beta-D-glucosidase n=2 Tax=Spirodela intermedia TaxID=51605 RepID=A0A7I8LAM0_SPIIN|nr:unnamed protein product [Spirodela intermedia]CAA6670077.1 unnamed protein product [Spirodela intermedia]CAA7407121.1 unnamed protein product [Spirodela intermedia]